MRSSNIMTLFSEQPRRSTGPSAIMISLVVHGVAAALLLALRHPPRVNDQPDTERFYVRLLKAPRVETEVQRSVERGETRPVQQAAATGHFSSGGSSPAPSVPTQLPQLPPHTQILVQPDAPADLMLAQETPVPAVVLWAPENSPSKVIVAPPQQEPTVVKTQPAIIKPNREPNLSDLNMTTTPFPTRTPMLPPGSTSPIVVRGPEAVRQVPSTAPVAVEQPTPARVLSISPLAAEGPVVVPFANQAGKPGPAALTISPERGSGNSGSGNVASSASGVGRGDGPGAAKASDVAGAGGTGGSGAGAAGNGVAAGSDGGGKAGLVPGGELALTHLVLPRDGQFGIVVVGTSVAEQYPETAAIWSGRLVYTVYLHLGGKNWILQYSIPQADEAAAGGMITKPEAPWPYDIERPGLKAEDFNSDAILVHGFVNMAGRFEKLALVFPDGFAKAKLLLSALEQWQFRPARQNGHPAAVEVLLIIPEVTD